MVIVSKSPKDRVRPVINGGSNPLNRPRILSGGPSSKWTTKLHCQKGIPLPNHRSSGPAGSSFPECRSFLKFVGCVFSPGLFPTKKAVLLGKPPKPSINHLRLLQSTFLIPGCGFNGSLKIIQDIPKKSRKLSQIIDGFS